MCDRKGRIVCWIAMKVTRLALVQVVEERDVGAPLHQDMPRAKAFCRHREYRGADDAH